MYYRSSGSIPPKRHTQHRDDAGRLYSEELMGEEGFSSASSLLYHREIPSALCEVRDWEVGDLSLTPNHPLRPLHFRGHDLFAGGPADGSADSSAEGSGDGGEPAQRDLVTGRRLLLGNGDVRLSYAWATTPSEFYRNAIGDELVFVEAGTATVETVFGDLEVGPGDYVLLPRATTHRWVPTGEAPLQALCIEANSHITPPRRYLSKTGQFLESSPYCERDLRVPAPLAPQELAPGETVDVLVKHRSSRAGGIAGSVHVVPQHPFDVVGWDGALYPYAFNIADFEPITGRLHQPPPVHQVFEGAGFVVCNFVPRKVDYHPLSIPVPYYHSNVDSDEVLFYVAGDYEARKGSGIGKGSFSLHPGGHSHGPQPGAVERSLGVQSFDETAVMVDTFRPLDLGEAGLASDDGRYLHSWTPAPTA